MPTESRNVTVELSLPKPASPRHAELTAREASSDRGRTIGGDLGDLRFFGYRLEGDRTILIDPELLRADFQDWGEDDINSLAHQILHESYNSIGVECVEHN